MAEQRPRVPGSRPASWLARFAGEDREFGEIGSNSGVTVLKLIMACEKVGGTKINYEVVPPRPSELVARCDNLKAELGWSPMLEGIGPIAETAHCWHSRYQNRYADKDKS